MKLALLAAKCQIYCTRMLESISHHLLLTVQTTRSIAESPSIHAVRRIVEQNFHPRISISKYRYRVPVNASEHSHPHIRVHSTFRQQRYGSMRQGDVSQTHLFQRIPHNWLAVSKQLRLQIERDGAWTIVVHPNEAEAFESGGEAAQVVV